MNDIIKLIAENGVLIVIAGMVLYFAWKFGNMYLSKLDVAKETKLINHELFMYIQNCYAFGINTLHIENKNKALLFKVMMKVKMHVISDKCMKFILSVDGEKLSAKELKSKNIQLLTDIVEGYENEWRKIGIAEFIIEDFRKWHMPRIQGVLDSVEHICDSQYYASNTSKQASIFYTYYNGVHIAMIDAHASFNDMNGHAEEWCNNNPSIIDNLKNHEL